MSRSFGAKPPCLTKKKLSFSFPFSTVRTQNWTYFFGLSHAILQKCSFSSSDQAFIYSLRVKKYVFYEWLFIQDIFLPNRKRIFTFDLGKSSLCKWEKISSCLQGQPKTEGYFGQIDIWVDESNSWKLIMITLSRLGHMAYDLWWSYDIWWTYDIWWSYCTRWIVIIFDDI